MPQSPTFAQLASAFSPTSNTGAASVAVANTDYPVAALNPIRRLLLLSNTHATATIYVNFGAPAWDGFELAGLPIAAGAGVFFDVAVPNSDIHIASATDGATYFLLEG